MKQKTSRSIWGIDSVHVNENHSDRKGLKTFKYKKKTKKLKLRMKNNNNKIIKVQGIKKKKIKCKPALKEIIKRKTKCCKR